MFRYFNIHDTITLLSGLLLSSLILLLYSYYLKAFMEAGRARINGDTKREADSTEMDQMRKENADLKEALAEETLRVRFLKKLSKGME
tara:strand:+ start:683 stop:946 length:264 start_codon:yes stop_codon:yes gene_type:complete